MFICPNCGCEVEEGALVCPECGSDEETGWSEEAEYDGLDLPDSDDQGGPTGAGSGEGGWNAVAIGVVVLILLLILLGLW